MKTKDLILKYLRSHRSAGSSTLVKHLGGISRQTVAEHLRALVSEGRVLKQHSTRNAVYSLTDGVKRKSIAGQSDYSRTLPLRNLQEDETFKKASSAINLRHGMSEGGFRIVNYAFTEMLNNAIDHSRSKKARVDLRCRPDGLVFAIRDNGIGVFESVRKKFRLHSHFEAAEHLLKGKQTTDPARHSGQGIFFTSKIADCFVLESAKLQLTIDNKSDDTVMKDIPFLKGTRVSFSLRPKTRKKLKELFDEYSGNDYEFDKTRLTVHLSEKEGEFISRSQAKRLTFGLEKFKTVILDFKKVTGISQSFADEIYRVFKNNHPTIRIEAVNTSPAVRFMIDRV